MITCINWQTINVIPEDSEREQDIWISLSVNYTQLGIFDWVYANIFCPLGRGSMVDTTYSILLYRLRLVYLRSMLYALWRRRLIRVAQCDCFPFLYFFFPLSFAKVTSPKNCQSFRVCDVLQRRSYALSMWHWRGLTLDEQNGISHVHYILGWRFWNSAEIFVQGD